MTNKITDLENQQQQQQHTSLMKDSDQLRTLSEEELQGVVGGASLVTTTPELAVEVDTD